jgi:hypothetical protein
MGMGAEAYWIFAVFPSIFRCPHISVACVTQKPKRRTANHFRLRRRAGEYETDGYFDNPQEDRRTGDGRLLTIRRRIGEQEAGS